jgi:hypothetical protein
LLGTVCAVFGLCEVGHEADDFILVFASDDIDTLLCLGHKRRRSRTRSLTRTPWSCPQATHRRTGHTAIRNRRTLTGHGTDVLIFTRLDRLNCSRVAHPHRQKDMHQMLVHKVTSRDEFILAQALSFSIKVLSTLPKAMRPESSVSVELEYRITKKARPTADWASSSR